jgi:enoyl-CoA hydratase/carnithine racemase
VTEPDHRPVLFDVDPRGVARIVLNRPASGNARNQEMREELLAAYAQISREPERIRVVVLTGAGARFFCAGMDLKESGQPESPAQRRARLSAGRDIDVLATLPVPTIAAINGYALGGGLEMALACDLRVAADQAKLGLPELRYGLVPGGGGTQRLPRLVGASRALELVLRADPISAGHAARIGLVNEVVPSAELTERADALAGYIAQFPSEATRAVKRLIGSALDRDLDAGLADEFDVLLHLMELRPTATVGDR